MKKIILLLSILCLASCLCLGGCSCSDEAANEGDANSSNGNGTQDKPTATVGKLVCTLSEDKTYYIVSGLNAVINGNLTIPNSCNGKPIKAIGERAFENCDGLEAISIHEGIVEIGKYAFHDCDKIRQISLPSTVTSVGKGAFSCCVMLNSINVSEHNISYKSVAGCLLSKNGETFIQYPVGRTITSYNMPSTVKAVEPYAFSNCQNLVSVSLSKELTSIGEEAFYNCNMLKEINIPGGVTKIGSKALADCDRLESINVEKRNPIYKTVDGSLYNNSCTELIQYAVGKSDTGFSMMVSVTAIHPYAFSGASKLENIYIPSRVATVGKNAFMGCRSLTIFTGAKSQPSTWDVDWNPDQCSVKWGK